MMQNTILKNGSYSELLNRTQFVVVSWSTGVCSISSSQQHPSVGLVTSSTSFRQAPLTAANTGLITSDTKDGSEFDRPS